MNTCDFDFINLQQESKLGKTREKVAGDDRRKRGPPLLAPETSRLMVNDGDRFMRIVKQTSQIKCHRELFELLQSEEIQCFIPHQVLISAWGDFGGLDLQHERAARKRYALPCVRHRGRSTSAFRKFIPGRRRSVRAARATNPQPWHEDSH